MVKLPFHIGLKLYSTNIDLIPEAQRLWDNQLYQYIELYTLPGTVTETLGKWSKCHIPFIIHAPHSLDGVNLALKAQQNQNLQHLEEAQRLADILDSSIIIIHGGHSGNIFETIRQVKLINDNRLILENKPKIGIKGENCVGWSPQEFLHARSSGAFGGFAFDFGHAVCAAISMQKEPLSFIHQFIQFEPVVFHISDGDDKTETDTHHNLGNGNFQLHRFIKLISSDSQLTVECPRSKGSGLSDFIKDVNFIKRFF